MVRAKQFLSTLFYNKFFWQLIMASLMIGMAIFFVKHEQLEVLQIRDQLAHSKSWYVLLGIVVTGVYLLFQAQMYVNCFRAVGKKIRIGVALRLYLKRNLISVFLPAGGFSSLVFFTREVEDQGVTKAQIHLASTIFGVTGIISVVIVAIPVLGMALFMSNLQQAEMLGFGFLLLLASGLIVLVFSAARKGIAYRWLISVRPSAAIMLDEMIVQKIDRKQLWLALFSSIAIEFIGILHLFVAMLALGFEPSLPAAIIGYIVMVILLIASPFLRGMGAIEVSLTLVLEQFGFPLLAAASITLMYRFFEFWLPLITGLFSFISKKDNLILRVLPALIIFGLGFVNIVSAITPAIPGRLRFMRNLLFEDIIVTSNGLVLVSGLLLIILSVFLLLGSRRAWYIGLGLTILSVVGHLLKAADYEEAILALVAMAVLLYTRRFYKLKPHPRFTKISYFVLLYSVLALLFFGVIGLYFIDKRHFGTDFELWVAVKSILRLFFLFDASGLEPRTVFAQNFLYSIYCSGGLVLAFIFFALLKPYFNEPYNTEDDKALVKKLTAQYGKSALDYFKIYPDKFFFIAKDREGFIAFKVTRHFAFVLENPVCKDKDAMMKLIRDFDQFCEENGFICVYYRIPRSSLDVYKQLKKKSFPIGEEAIIDLATFTLEGQKIKPTRNAINRLTAEGYEIKIYHPPVKEGLLQKLEHVSDSWLKELNQKEMAFTQGVFDRSILKNETIITIEDREEKVYAFLNLIPDFADGEATYDLMRKVAEAPNGVLDMLLAKTLLYLKAEGYKTVNLGMAPLSGIDGVNLTQKSIRYAYENLRHFGHFKGLRKYKDKFFPRWEQKYLIYSNSYHLLQVPNALKRVSEEE